MSALDKQVGGDHYKKFQIQPAEFCYVNNIPYLEATAIKYLCRWKDKGGLADLDKAIHFIKLLKEFTNKELNEQLKKQFVKHDSQTYYNRNTGEWETVIRPLTGEKNVTSTL